MLLEPIDGLFTIWSLDYLKLNIQRFLNLFEDEYNDLHQVVLVIYNH